MFQRILVPLDGSLRAEQAIPIAARIARACQGMLILVHIAPSPGSDTPFESELLQARLRTQLDEAHQYLTAIASSREIAGLPLTVAALPGPVVATLLSAIHTYQPDLLVLCEQNSPQEPLQPVGGLARQLIEQTTTPLLPIPAQGSLSFNQRHPLTFLVACDGPQPAPQLMKPAISLLAVLATQGQGRLHCVPLLSFLASPDSSAVTRQADDRRVSSTGLESSKARSTAVSLQEVPVDEEADGREKVNDGDLLVLGMPVQQKKSKRTLRKSGQPFLSQKWSTLPLLLVPLVGTDQ